jgi:hypothetical protein
MKHINHFNSFFLNEVNIKNTRESVTELAKKYKTLKEFREKESSAYQFAYKNGFLRELGLEGDTLHTKEGVIKLAKNYKTLSDFRNNEAKAYQYAQKNNFLDELGLVKVNISFTKDQVIDLSKKYKTLKEFRINEPKAYQYAHRNNFLDELGLSKGLGLTKDGVIELAKKYKNSQEFRENEPSAYNYAQKNNFLDELGLEKNRYSVHTKESVIELAKKYKTLKEFREKEPGPYQFAYRNGFLRELGLEGVDFLYRTKEGVIELAKNYKNIQEFRENEPGAYQYAWRNNFLDELGLEGMKTVWTDEALIDRANKYDLKSQLTKNDSSVYQILLKRGLIYDLYGPGRTVWNAERIGLIANNFSSLTRFKKMSPIAFRKAEELGLTGLLNRIFGTPKPRGRTKRIWTEEELREEALKYDNKTDFRRFSPTAVTAAEEMGIYQEITAHMKKTPADEEKKYTIFKTTFPDGHTHYARFANMGESNDYLGYCVSQSKNIEGGGGVFLEKIRETPAEQIQTEVVKTSLDEDESYSMMIDLIKNDNDSINKLAKIKTKIADYSAASYITIPKKEFIKLKDNTYWMKSTFYKENEKEYRGRVDTTKDIKNPINGLRYFRIKASYRVLVPGEKPEDAASELFKKPVEAPEPYTGDDISDLSYEEILKRVQDSRKLKENLITKFSDFIKLL